MEFRMLVYYRLRKQDCQLINMKYWSYFMQQEQKSSTCKRNFAFIPTIDSHFLCFNILSEINRHEFFQSFEILKKGIFNVLFCRISKLNTNCIFKSIVTKRCIVFTNELQTIATRTFHPFDCIDFVLVYCFDFACTEIFEYNWRWRQFQSTGILTTNKINEIFELFHRTY